MQILTKAKKKTGKKWEMGQNKLKKWFGTLDPDKYTHEGILELNPPMKEFWSSKPTQGSITSSVWPFEICAFHILSFGG